MKQGFLKLVGKTLAPAALVIAMAFSPVGAFAANRGGGGHGGGFGGGHAGGFNGGHSFSAPARSAPARGNVGGNFNGGRNFSAPSREFNRGGREFSGGRAFYGDRGYYRPGFGIGVGVYAPYGYAAPVCNPAGFYDAYGVWQLYPGCAVPYGY